MAKKKKDEPNLNKGEWGEPYVLLRLVGDGRIALADENEQEIDGYYLEILETLRHESKERHVRYIQTADMGDYYQVLITVNDKPTAECRSDLFAINADRLMEEVNTKGKEISAELLEFFESIQVTNFKATSVEKSDIFVCAGDPRSGTVRRDIGYSIKTKWGQPSTLFNFGTNGNRSIYRLIGDVDEELMNRVNNVFKDNGDADVISRWRMLAEHGIKFEFVDYAMAKRAKCRAFALTLDMISPYAIPMFESVVRAHFETGTPRVGCPMPEINQWLIEHNPSGVKRPEVQYEYMLKTFLYAAHGSVTASKPWNGRNEVNGGLITVDKQGKVLAYNALDGEKFKGFLFTHTCIDFPSTKPKKGKYGFVYWNKELDCYCFDLNFIIRYINF